MSGFEPMFQRWDFVPQGFGRLGRWNHLAEFYGWGANGGMGWVGFWCLGIWMVTKDATKTCTEHNCIGHLGDGVSYRTNGKMQLPCMMSLEKEASIDLERFRCVELCYRCPVRVTTSRLNKDRVIRSCSCDLKTTIAGSQTCFTRRSIQSFPFSDFNVGIVSPKILWTLHHLECFCREKSISSPVSEGKVFIHP